MTEPRHQDAAFSSTSGGDWKRYLKPGLWVLLTLFVVVFVLSNFTDVTVSFVFFQVQVKLFWVLLLCVLLGVGLSSGWRMWRRSRRAD